jgi:rhodanese-related sulfurtransferase
MNQDFENLGFVIDGLRHLTGRQAYECCQKGAIMVDVREEFEVAIKAFGVRGVLFCPFDSFDKIYSTLPKEAPLIIADSVGIHSKDAARKLLDNGYTLISNLAGGIMDWERDGLPMNKDIESMNGQCPCMMKSRTT